MKGFFKTSIGKKLIMSLSGLFLISFLLVHLIVNSFLLFDDTGELFNLGAHFMATNPAIKIMEPLLAAGFLFHIIYSVILTLQNRKARGNDRYAQVNQGNSSSWSSRNMFVLGAVVLGVMGLHIANFYIKLKFGEIPHVTIDGVQMEDAYALVSKFFITQWWYDVLYIIWAIFLGLHLRHAFWSALQTLGFSNNLWRTRLTILGNVYAVFIAAGFTVIPLYFLIFG